MVQKSLSANRRMVQDVLPLLKEYDVICIKNESYDSSSFCVGRLCFEVHIRAKN